MLRLFGFWHLGARSLCADNENAPPVGHTTEMIAPSHVRALATGAALATSLDTSPAVLVSMYAYARGAQEMRRRTA